MTKAVLSAFICVHLRLLALPLWFEPNTGQVSADMQFLSRSVYLGAGKAAIYAVDKTIVMTLIGARRGAQAQPLDAMLGVSNYYLGNDPQKWHTDVPHYARVRYTNIYPGIDLVYYYNAAGRLEYDFHLAPRADANAIQVSFNYPVRTDVNGDLLVAGLRQKRPKVYQRGQEITCNYLVHDRHTIQLALATYDRAQPLTIDPVIEYSTYVGGNGDDSALGIALDVSESAYVVGHLESPRYPNLDPFQQASGTGRDIVVAKFTPSGNALVFYTYVGGSGFSNGMAIALDVRGNTYVAGSTQSPDFPTKNAAQPRFGGGFDNAVIFKLASNGTLMYSTYLGGNNQEEALGLAVDASGSAFVSGFAYSVDFPTKNALQPTLSGRPSAFLAKLSPAGDQFLFSTYLGGSGRSWGKGVTLDPSGNPIVVGWTESADFPVLNALQSKLGGGAGSSLRGGTPLNGFVTKISARGDKILYSTYVGSSSVYGPNSVALDSSGAIYLLGRIASDAFPVKNAIQSTYGGGQMDVALAKLTPAGDAIAYATYLGGSDLDYDGGLAVAPDGTAYITGTTYSADFPTKNSLQPFVSSTHSFKCDAFVARVSPSGSLVYSTILGGNGDDRGWGIAVDSSGRVHVAGATNSDDFPTKSPLQAEFGGGPHDMFYLRFAPEAAPSPQFTASPASLPFRFVIGGPMPAAQPISVTSTAGPLGFNPVSSAAWLKFTASSGTTPALLTISVDPSGLTPGTYAGAIQIDSQTSVQVNLTVLAPAPTATGISPTSVPVGADTTTITITGSGFQNGAAVQLNGISFPTTFVDSGTLQLTLDKSNLKQPATLAFTVVNPQSAPSAPITFTIGTPIPQFTATSITNAASFSAGPVAPGEIVTIFGTNLDKNVTFDGIPATLVYFSSAQVSVTVPYAITGPTTTIQVGSSAPVKLDVALSAPGIFAAVPAGDKVVVLYATGCGTLTKDDLPLCALPVSVTVNGESAEVLYAGVAPGLVEGANQVNIKLPNGITSGPLTIRVYGRICIEHGVYGDGAMKNTSRDLWKICARTLVSTWSAG